MPNIHTEDDSEAFRTVIFSATRQSSGFFIDQKTDIIILTDTVNKRRESMDSSIIASIITGLVSLAGVIISNIISNKNIEQKLTVSQAVTETQIENLTREVLEHNSFAQKIPVLEMEIQNLKHEMNRRRES